MIFHRARIKNKYENTVQIQGNIIDHVNITKFLGIIKLVRSYKLHKK